MRAKLRLKGWKGRGVYTVQLDTFNPPPVRNTTAATPPHLRAGKLRSFCSSTGAHSVLSSPFVCQVCLWSLRNSLGFALHNLDPTRGRGECWCGAISKTTRCKHADLQGGSSGGASSSLLFFPSSAVVVLQWADCCLSRKKKNKKKQGSVWRYIVNLSRYFMIVSCYNAKKRITWVLL